MKPFLFLFLMASAQATLITLSWQTSPEGDIAYYTVYARSGSEGLTEQARTSKTNATLEADTTTRFSVTAVNQAGLMSSNSNEVLVIFTNAPVATNIGRLRIISYVQTMLEDDSWRVNTNFVSEARIKNGVAYRSENYVELFKPNALRLQIYIQEQLPITLSWVNATNFQYSMEMESNKSYRVLSFTELSP